MSENDYQPQQDRPSRTSSNASPTRRTTPTRRSYTANRRTTTTGSASRSDGARTSYGSYGTRGDNARSTSEDFSSQRTRAEQSRTSSVGSEGSVAEGMLGSLKEAVSSGREAISSRVSSIGENAGAGSGAAGTGEGPLQNIMDKLPGDNVWVKRGILIVAALVVILILANLVTCAAGALSGGASKATSSAATEESSQEASSQASSAATQQGVASPWTDDGTFSTGDSTLDAYIKDLCDKHSTDGASYEDNAYDTYIYVSRTDYIERENNQSPWGPTWDIEYAKQYFEEGNTGNCYNYAAVVEYVLKYFGYSDAEAEPCVVALESGAWGDHGLVFVTNKADSNKRCIIDSSLSANGWMLDIDSYQYDIRNINQNSTIEGNVDVLGDNDTPTRIPAGELTETESSSSASASTESADTETQESTDESLTENTDDEEVYYEEVYYEDTDDEGSYDDGSEEEVYYEETYEEGDGEYYEDGEEEVYYEEEEA